MADRRIHLWKLKNNLVENRILRLSLSLSYLNDFESITSELFET